MAIMATSIRTVLSEAGLANVRTAQRIVEAIRESLPKSMASR